MKNLFSSRAARPLTSQLFLLKLDKELFLIRADAEVGHLLPTAQGGCITIKLRSSARLKFNALKPGDVPWMGSDQNVARRGPNRV